MRALPAVCLALCLLSANACLEIERVPDAEVDASGGSAGQSGDGGLAGAFADFDAGACPNACMDQHPEARALFQALSACVGLGRGDQCAADCEEGATGNTTPSCTTLGVVDPRPTCNACVKDLCCGELAACLANQECFATSLCSSGCE